MPAVCSAYNCKNRSNKTTNISYFTFPLKNKLLAEKWVIAMRRENWMPTQHTRLCSCHFEAKFMYKVNNQRRLYYSAVPSIFDFTKNNLRKGPLANERCVNSPRASPKSAISYMRYRALLENDTCQLSDDPVNGTSCEPWEHDHGLYSKQLRLDPHEASGTGRIHSPGSQITDTASEPDSDTDTDTEGAQSQLVRQRLHESSQDSRTDRGHSRRRAREANRSTVGDGESELGCSRKRPRVYGPHQESLQRHNRLHSSYPFSDKPADVLDVLDIKEEPFPEELPVEKIYAEEKREKNMVDTWC